MNRETPSSVPPAPTVDTAPVQEAPQEEVVAPEAQEAVDTRTWRTKESETMESMAKRLEDSYWKARSELTLSGPLTRRNKELSANQIQELESSVTSISEQLNSTSLRLREIISRDE